MKRGGGLPLLARRLPPRVRGAGDLPEARAADDQALRQADVPTDPERLHRAHLEHAPGRSDDRLLRKGGERVASRRKISFDALWEADVRFVIDFDVEMKIKYKSMTFFGVSVSGRFTGPDPKRVQGEWSVDLWLFSIGGPFDFTIGEDRPPAALPPDGSADRADRSAARCAQLERPAAAGEPEARRLPQPPGLAGGARPSARRARRAPVGAAARDRARPLRRRRALRRPALRDHQGASWAPIAVTELSGQRAVRGGGLHRADRRREDPSPVVRGHARGCRPRAEGARVRRPGARDGSQAADSEIDFEEIVVDADGNVVRQAQPKTLGPRARAPRSRSGRRRSHRCVPAARRRFAAGPGLRGRRGAVHRRGRGRPRAGRRWAGPRRRSSHAAVHAGARAAPGGEPAGPRHSCRSSLRSAPRRQ